MGRAWATWLLDGDVLEVGLQECAGVRHAYTLRRLSELAKRRRELEPEELAELVAYEWADAQATLMGLTLDRVSRVRGD